MSGGLLLEVSMQCNARREFFTSLVGTVPLTDGKKVGKLARTLITDAQGGK